MCVYVCVQGGGGGLPSLFSPSEIRDLSHGMSFYGPISSIKMKSVALLQTADIEGLRCSKLYCNVCTQCLRQVCNCDPIVRVRIPTQG